ncbi:hypothetical protein [Shimazuella alba]|uniref:NurA domain-containing protein n=1 Tax=Shimazuella alba TaxID=2690964 RepID=A0A6I4VTS0_9BACL|nr:hypothetical protein [Shimazuella alba]MXQ54967.1 hypothetical protein [Shimazuella alba]
MAYNSNGKMPFEFASKLGHLDIIKNDFVKELINEFESVQFNSDPKHIEENTYTVDVDKSDIRAIITIDGSCSTLENAINKKKSISFIKIATLMIGLEKLEQAQSVIVDPKLINEIITQYSDTICTVLPLNNVKIKGISPLETIRRIVNITIREKYPVLYETLRFLVFKEWLNNYDSTISFSCPMCGHVNIKIGEFDQFICGNVECGQNIFLTDYIGLHMEFSEENTNESIALNFMQVLEHLWYLSYLISIYKDKKYRLSQILLLKDGPLILNSQYSRLVIPIREFIQHLKDSDVKAYLVGIEKSGPFTDHAEIISKNLKQVGEVFIPSNKYIFSNIKSGGSDTDYGERVLYGSKLFVKIDENNVIVATIPTGEYTSNPKYEDFYGINEIVKILVQLRSKQFANALLPIVAVNKLASMSVYPTNNILQKFADSMIGVER